MNFRKKISVLSIACILTGCGSSGVRSSLETASTEPTASSVTDENSYNESTADISMEQISNETDGSVFAGKLMEQLDPEQDELLYERYQQDADKNVENVIKVSEIYAGSFTGTEKEELLVLLRFCSEPPHVAGLDHIIAAVYDADTLDILAQYSLEGDHNTVQPLSDQSGRSVVLVLADIYGQGGTVSQTQHLYKIENGTFSETDPLGASRDSDEFFDYDSYLSKYCILTGGSTLLVYDVSGTKSEDEHDYELEYELKHVMKWSSDAGSFEEEVLEGENNASTTDACRAYCTKKQGLSF